MLRCVIRMMTSNSNAVVLIVRQKTPLMCIDDYEQLVFSFGQFTDNIVILARTHIHSKL